MNLKRREELAGASAAIGLLIIILGTILLSGCSAPSSQYRRPTTGAAPAQQQAPKYFVPKPQGAGWVPVDIANPSTLKQEVFLFEGSAAVDLMPDVRTGGWMFNRPAMAHFAIQGANSPNNWHQYERLYLPRDASFILVSRTINFWGAGPPEFYSFRAGRDPYALEYTRITPSFPRAYAGGLVVLRERSIAPFGDGPVIIEYTIDSRPIGRAITDGATRMIYGR